MNTVSYQDLQRVLAAERSVAEPAEAHGTLAGCLCASPQYRFEDWLQEILPEGQAQPAAETSLRGLFAATAAALASHEMEFQLLLPDDADSIDARASALGQWCQGFLYGLGSGALRDASALPGEVGELVRDLTEITRVGVNTAESEEDNESAYAELVEFVRVGVQLLFEELAGARRATGARSAPLH